MSSFNRSTAPRWMSIRTNPCRNRKEPLDEPTTPHSGDHGLWVWCAHGCAWCLPTTCSQIGENRGELASPPGPPLSAKGDHALNRYVIHRIVGCRIGVIVTIY